LLIFPVIKAKFLALLDEDQLFSFSKCRSKLAPKFRYFSKKTTTVAITQHRKQVPVRLLGSMRKDVPCIVIWKHLCECLQWDSRFWFWSASFIEKFRLNKDGAGAFKALTDKYELEGETQKALLMSEFSHSISMRMVIREKLSKQLRS